MSSNLLDDSTEEASFTAYGKWILTGEHSVLRGAPALVFPLKSYGMKAEFKNYHEDFSLHVYKNQDQENHNPETEVRLRTLFWMLLKKATELKDKNLSDLKGQLTVYNITEMGRGLGSSATLCVILSKWFFVLGWIKENEIYSFAHSLENIFHGESSGVDIAGSLSDTGIFFQQGEVKEKINLNWKPHWYLSFCGKAGTTSECVYKVKAFGEKNPDLFKEIDEQMSKATLQAQKALQLNSEKGFPLLSEAISQASNCFKRWNLTEDLEEHMDKLKSLGACATKPTGSGGGGYVLSLWKEKPKDAASLIDLSPDCSFFK